MTKIVVRPFVAALLFCLVLISACKDPEDTIGLELQPEEDLLGILSSDTFFISPYAIPGDSMKTSSTQTVMLIGDMDNGPNFGRASSEMFAQFRIENLAPDFGEGFVLDSLVLGLQYVAEDSIYGDPNELLTFTVNELIDSLSFDSAYYSNDASIMYDPVNWVEPGQEMVHFGQGLTVVGGDTLVNQLRIRLDNDIAMTKFVDGQPTGGHFSMSAFLDYFKGLRIAASSSAIDGGAMGRFDANASNSKMTLYYHNDADTLVSFDYLLNNLSQRYLKFDFDRFGSAVQTQFDDISTGRDKLYFQAMTGANIVVDMPFIKHLNDTMNIAVNKAELVFKVDQSAQNLTFKVPPMRMFGFYEEADGDTEIIQDFFDGETHADGFYDEDDQEYRLNITGFLQNVINENIETTSVRLVTSSNDSSPNFVTLYGPDNSAGPAKLIVTYTKY